MLVPLDKKIIEKSLFKGPKFDLEDKNVARKFSSRSLTADFETLDQYFSMIFVPINMSMKYRI